MAKKSMREYSVLSERFIALANDMKSEGNDLQMVNASLMSASGIYATYTAAGNDGGLNPSGVDKVVAVYKENLESIQRLKLQQGTKAKL